MRCFVMFVTAVCLSFLLKLNTDGLRVFLPITISKYLFRLPGKKYRLLLRLQVGYKMAKFFRFSRVSVREIVRKYIEIILMTNMFK